MEQGDLLKLIRDEVKKQLESVLLPGLAGSNSQFSEDMSQVYPGMPTLSQRPVMHPYGLSSRAPSATLQVTGRTGAHPGARMVLGHRDASRPLPANAGEVMLYDAYGHVVYLSKTKLQFGSASSNSAMVLGDQLQTFLNNLMTAIAAITVTVPSTPGTFGINNAATFSGYKTTPIGDGTLVSSKAFTEK